MTRLRRSDLHGPGISRIARGRGFEYRLPDGTRVDDAAEIDRYRALAIPPAWTDVWISPHPNGHIAAGRHRRRRAATVPLPSGLA